MAGTRGIGQGFHCRLRTVGLHSLTNWTGLAHLQRTVGQEFIADAEQENTIYQFRTVCVNRKKHFNHDSVGAQRVTIVVKEVFRLSLIFRFSSG